MENLYTAQSIRTFTGRYVDVLNPTEDMIDIEDIAHALSNICRWGGHVPRFYSVAEHSVHCSNLTTSENALDALLHDASEAYLMDIPRPIKQHLFNYKTIEDRLMTVIASKFGMTYPLTDAVKSVDNQLLELEWKDLILNEKKSLMLMCHSPAVAKRLFLNRFNELKN